MSLLNGCRSDRYVKGKIGLDTNETPGYQNWQGEASAVRICETYLTNKFLIEQLCQRIGVTPIFVWQPSPAYKYDLQYHPFAPPASAPAEKRYHYKIMPEYYQKMRQLSEARPEVNFLWCADIQEGRAECLYCDRYHYTGAFSKDLAAYICKLCLERKLLDQHLQP
jgi:hypothetical protein